MAYLKDIAAATGVSIRTVKRALSGQGYINPETRTQVLAHAQRLGYRPNLAARSLKTSTSTSVSVVAGSMDELHIAKIAAFEQTLRQAGYSVNVLLEHGNKNVGSEWLEHILDHRPAGVALIYSAQLFGAQTMQPLLDSGLPYIVLDAPPGTFDSVRIDRQQGVYEAVLYLAAKGRKQIAYLDPMKDRSRLDGYLRALDQLQRQPLYLETESGGQYKAGFEAAQRLGSLPRPTDAVIAYADELALGFMAGLHAQGILIPERVALIGFDDRRAAALSWPQLTTVAQPNHELGVAAAEILLRKIAGEARPSAGWDRALPTHLVTRESA